MRRDLGVSLAPLLEPSFQIVIGLTGKARKHSNTLTVRTVTKLAGRNLIAGHSYFENLFPARGKGLVTISGSFWRQHSEVSRQIAFMFGQDPRRDMRHVIHRKRIIPLPASQAIELSGDVSAVLASQARRNPEALH
jgi:hypothetical protein